MAAALRLPPWSVLEMTVLMKKRFLTSLLFISALCCLLLCGCGGNGELSGGSISSPSPSPSQSPAPSQDDVSASEAPGPAAPQVLCVNAPEDIQDELCLAMAQLCQPRAMDISGLALEQPEGLPQAQAGGVNLLYFLLCALPAFWGHWRRGLVDRRALGARVQTVYSPMDALEAARADPAAEDEKVQSGSRHTGFAWPAGWSHDFFLKARPASRKISRTLCFRSSIWQSK